MALRSGEQNELIKVCQYRFPQPDRFGLTHVRKLSRYTIAHGILLLRKSHVNRRVSRLVHAISDAIEKWLCLHLRQLLKSIAYLVLRSLRHEMLRQVVLLWVLMMLCPGKSCRIVTLLATLKHLLSVLERWAHHSNR